MKYVVRITGKREPGKAPEIFVDDVPVRNRHPDHSDWFSWGHKGIGTRIAAISIADELWDHYCRRVGHTSGIGNGGNPAKEEAFFEALQRVKTNTFTMELEEEDGE